MANGSGQPSFEDLIARALMRAFLLFAMIGGAALEPAAAAEGLVPLPPQPQGVPWPSDAWPRGELPSDLDRAAFDAATTSLFEPRTRGGLGDTRALLVVRGGRIVYERYAEGFGPDSRFQSWSMAKSVTQALVGILVRQGELAVDEPAPVPAWRQPGDPRAEISLDHMLHMTTGLANRDGFEDGGRYVGDLLFGEGAASPWTAAATAMPEVPPGTRWAYSTGTSMILAAIVGSAVGRDAPERLGFMRRELFGPLGMQSAVPEFDSSGQFMGGAFFYATAQDWARFGYLYLRDGVWDGRRVLPEGWVDFSRTPAPAANNGIHGAHLWLNGEPAEGQWKMYPGAPRSAFAAEGNAFQVVLMVPTHDLVVVRLGQTPTAQMHMHRPQIGALVSSFPELGER